MNILTEIGEANNIWYDIALIGIGILATLVGGIGLKLLYLLITVHIQLHLNLEV